jgi:hypothetical protein
MKDYTTRGSDGKPATAINRKDTELYEGILLARLSFVILSVLRALGFGLRTKNGESAWQQAPQDA